MDTIETTGVELANGHGDTSAHEDGVVANFSEVALATETVGGIGVRTLRCQVEFEVIICVTEALDNGQSLDRSVGKLDLIELRDGVLRVRAGVHGDFWWICKGAVVWVVWLLTLNQLWDNWDSSSEAEACRKGSNFAKHYGHAF